jgi:hypothetical protein
MAGEPQWYYNWLFSNMSYSREQLLELGRKEPYFRFCFDGSCPTLDQIHPIDEDADFFSKWLDEEIDKNIDLTPKKDEPKKCTCPDINFYFNGIGCKCGGV